MKGAVTSEPCYLIHSIPYQETSAILSLFSLNHGIVQTVAKGMRRPKNSLKSTLQLFRPLLISWVGKGDLKTLTQAETASSYYVTSQPASGLSYCCGLYINELLIRLMPSGASSEDVFSAYVDTVTHLFTSEGVEHLLRHFESVLLQELGGFPDFEYDVNTGAAIVVSENYSVTPGIGFYRAETEALGAFSGKAILAIREKNYDDVLTLKAAKRINRLLIDHHLEGKPLNSRNMLRKLLEFKND